MKDYIFIHAKRAVNVLPFKKWRGFSPGGGDLRPGLHAIYASQFDIHFFYDFRGGEAEQYLVSMKCTNTFYAI